MQTDGNVQPKKKQQIKEAKTSQIKFVIVALLYQILVCLLYGLLIGYETGFSSQFNIGDVILVTVLALLALIGFGLVNSYITNSAFSGMSMSLLIFALAIQHYFLMRAFWYKAGVYSESAGNTFSDSDRFNQVSYANKGEDLQLMTYNLPVSSMADAIACSISLLIAFSPVIGRVSLLEVFFLTLFGSWVYELNNLLLWRLYITDSGYGMRVFVFGSFLGLISAIILGKQQTTKDHHRYLSNYSSQTFGLIGTCFIVCALPFLSVASLYRTSTNDSAILLIAALNMWFSLIAGVLGSYTACTISYAKIFLHDIIFGGIAGGIAYSSSSDLHENPAAPLGVGFLAGIVTTFGNSLTHRKANKEGVSFSLSLINRFLFPAIICGIISAVMQGIGQSQIIDESNTTTLYALTYDSGMRSATGQGGFQLLGLLLSAVFGSAAGAIIGGLYKLVNRHDYNEQFDDNNVFHIEQRTRFRRKIAEE